MPRISSAVRALKSSVSIRVLQFLGCQDQSVVADVLWGPTSHEYRHHSFLQSRCKVGWNALSLFFTGFIWTLYYAWWVQRFFVFFFLLILDHWGIHLNNIWWWFLCKKKRLCISPTRQPLVVFVCVKASIKIDLPSSCYAITVTRVWSRSCVGWRLISVLNWNALCLTSAEPQCSSPYNIEMGWKPAKEWENRILVNRQCTASFFIIPAAQQNI